MLKAPLKAFPWTAILKLNVRPVMVELMAEYEGNNVMLSAVAVAEAVNVPVPDVGLLMLKLLTVNERF